MHTAEKNGVPGDQGTGTFGNGGACGGFRGHGGNGWFVMENPFINGIAGISAWFIFPENSKLKWMIWGYSHFRKPSYVQSHYQL